MTKIQVVYRCCEEDTKKEFRPPKFSKERCLRNFLDVFRYNPIKDVEVQINAVHDGPCGILHQTLDFLDIPIEKIDFKNNLQSLEYCLFFAAGAPESDIIYFVEDDYLHTDDALETLLEGFSLTKDSIISLYDHPDRYTRNDDVDYEKTKIVLGKKKYWRTAESTTCTWAITSKLYERVFDVAYEYGLYDRGLFRALALRNIKLHTPMVASSTHCHMPFMSPFVDWSDL